MLCNLLSDSPILYIWFVFSYYNLQVYLVKKKKNGIWKIKTSNLLCACEQYVIKYLNVEFKYLDFSWPPPDNELQQRLSITRFTHFLIKATSERLQVVFPIRVCKGNMDSSRTLNSIWTMLPCRPDGCILECWAVQNLLDTDGHPIASLARSDRNNGSNFWEVRNCTESSWNS